MTPNEQTMLVNFVGDLLQTYREHDHCDIDGFELQNLLDKHGLMYETVATEADCEEEWAQEWGYDPGDKMFRYGPLMLRLMDQARARAATERKARQ